MSTIPLYSPIKGYYKSTAKIEEEVKLAAIGGKTVKYGGYKYDRYARAVTPPDIARLVGDAIAEEEREAQKAFEVSKEEDPFAFMDNEGLKAGLAKLELPHIGPVLTETAISFGKNSSVALNHHRRRKSIGFNLNTSCTGQVEKVHSHHHSPSRDVATKLGLTLQSNFKHPDEFMYKTIHGRIDSCLPSHALCPLRSHEKPISEADFTNSLPSFIKHGSVDSFGIDYEENNIDEQMLRLAMGTPDHVQSLIAAEAERKAIAEARRAAAAERKAAASAVSSKEIKNKKKKSSRSSSRNSEGRISSQSSRVMSPSEVSDMSKPSSSQSTRSTKRVVMNITDDLGSPSPSEISAVNANDDEDPLAILSRQNSCKDKYDVMEGARPDFARVHSNKFFLSENDHEVRTAKLIEKRAKLQERKAKVTERNEQLLRQQSSKMTASQKRRPKMKRFMQSGYFNDIDEDVLEELKDFMGDQAKEKFSKLFYEAVHDLAKFPTEDEIPFSKRTPAYYFVREQAIRQLPPLPLLIRRETEPRGIFLGGKGLGDEAILPVIKVIDMLPVVESIDFSDNRLTDTSLMPLSEKLNYMHSLTHLNLSFNKIDESSATIMAYLRSSMCKLKTLYLNGADVDDFECANLMNAISDNATIENLGLSKNLIGKAETYNTVYPDLTTGGEALGEMLSANKKMKALDVSWNAIRLASAETLGSSLAINDTLLFLDISHNSFGDMGTQMLGFSLKSNHTLLDLNISYNSLVPRSACVLANALSYNTSLTMLNVDGNIIGKVGMQSLVAAMQRSASENRVLKISFEKCDTEKEDPDLFNPAHPGGVWNIDLGTPYGQMVAEECIFLSDYRAGCNITKLTLNNRIVRLNRKFEAADLSKFPIDEYHELCIRTSNDILAGKIKEAARNLSQILSRQFQFNMSVEVGIQVLTKLSEHWKAKTILSANNPLADELHDVFLFEVFYALFVINDVNQSKTMELEEFEETLANLGRPNFDRMLLRRLMSEFDVDDSGTIDANEFSMIMVNHFCNTDPPRGTVVDAATGEPWVVPKTGIAEFQVKYECELPKSSDIGADAGIDSVVFAMQEAKSSQQKQTLFEQAINSPYFYLNADQAQLLYDEVLEYSKHKLDAMALILPQIVNSEQCLQFLDHNLDEFGKLELRVKLGTLYNAYVGLPTGHYIIDLEDPASVKGGVRLAATSVSESNYCRAVGTNTSQSGVHSSFRNEECNEIHIEVTNSWFANCPKTGFVRFDFVSTHRPKLGTKSISDARFSRVLNKLALGDIEIERQKFEKSKKPYIVDSDEIGALPQFSISGRLGMPSMSPRGSLGNESMSPIAFPPINSPLSGRSSGKAAESSKKGAKSGKRAKTPNEPLVKPPVTIVHLKEYFVEYMESCHHHLDIMPSERKMTFTSVSNRCQTPPDFSFGEKPSTTAMPPIFAIGYRKLLELQILLPSIYLSVKQFTEILKCFPTEGYLRVQLLQSVFSRLVDLENLWPVIDEIYSEDEVREVLHRLGILNVYDPMFPDREYKLDLRRWDEREMAKILIVFAVAEPGENWIGEKFRWSKYDECVPGWCLPAKWTMEDTGDGEFGPQTHGWLTLKYTSYGKDCMANMAARKQLRKRTLVGMKRSL